MQANVPFNNAVIKHMFNFELLALKSTSMALIIMHDEQDNGCMLIVINSIRTLLM